MSLLAPLRASSSTPTARIALPYLRFASSSKAGGAKPISRRRTADAEQATAAAAAASSVSTVQSADLELERRKRNEANLKKSGQAVDILAMDFGIFESTAEPPFKISWLFQKGIWRYLSDRIKRYRTTIHGLNRLVEKGITYKRQASSLSERIAYLFSNRRPSNRFRGLLDELERVYVDYNKAQAATDPIALRALSTSTALESAQKVLKSNRKLSWNLDNTYSAPKLISARVAPISSDIEIAQVVVRFDTEQSLTVAGSASGNRNVIVDKKRQRLRENWAFELILPPQGGWKLKQKVPDTPPPVGDNA